VLGSLFFLSWCFSLNWISLSILHIKVHFIGEKTFLSKGQSLLLAHIKLL
jgi:hypothetical protein